MHQFYNYSRVILLSTVFLTGLGLISNATTQHDASTAEYVFALMNPNVNLNIAGLPMYQTGGQLGSGIIASPRMAAYAMELAQPGSGVRFAFRYGGGGEGGGYHSFGGKSGAETLGLKDTMPVLSPEMAEQIYQSSLAMAGMPGAAVPTSGIQILPETEK